MKRETAAALSVRERQAVDAVGAHYATHGRPPSVKEIGAAVGLEKSQTYDLVKQAARKGWLQLRCRRGHRTEIHLSRPLAETSTADLHAELARRAGNDPEDSSTSIAA